MVINDTKIGRYLDGNGIIDKELIALELRHKVKWTEYVKEDRVHVLRSDGRWSDAVLRVGPASRNSALGDMGDLTLDTRRFNLRHKVALDIRLFNLGHMAPWTPGPSV